MLEGREFWVLGGDLRQEKLAQLLYADGHRVHSFALDGANLPDGVAVEDGLGGVRAGDCVVLPLPAARDGEVLNAPMCKTPPRLEEVFGALPRGALICGGMVSQEVAGLAARYGHAVVDYFRREELIVANAVPTALTVWIRRRSPGGGR